MNPMIAEYYNQHVHQANLIAELANWKNELKEKWALSAMEKQVAQPEAWIWGCINRQKQQMRLHNIQYGKATAPMMDRTPSTGSTAQPWVAGTTAPEVWAPPVSPPPRPALAPSPAPPAVLPRHSESVDIPLSQPERRAASPASASGAAPGGPPAWIIEALQQSSSNKRLFLRSFMEHVPEATRGKLYALPFDTQMHLAWASLHLPSTWTGDLDKTVRQLLKAHAATTPAVSAIAASPGLPGGANRNVKLKPVYHGAGIGSGALSVQIGVLNVHRKYPQVKVELLGAYSSELNPLSEQIEKVVFRKLGVPLTQLGDATGWPSLVEQNIQDWKKMDFVLTPITSAPCTNISIANSRMNALKKGGVGGLHTPPTSIIHSCYEGDYLAASELGAHRYAHFMEFPLTSNDAERQVLDDMYGAGADVLSHERYGGFKRHRVARVSPQLPAGVPVAARCTKCDNKQTIDGWTWKGNTDGSNSFCDTVLRKHVTVNMEKLYTGDTIETWAKAGLENMKMVHEVTGEERYISREFWLRWMGHEPDTPIWDALQEVLPCSSFHIPSTGESATEQSPGAEACGKHLYCDNCTRALGLVALSWEIKGMSDYVTAWLETVVARNLMQQQTVDVTPKERLVHHCGETCSHRIGWKTIEGGG